MDGALVWVAGLWFGLKELLAQPPTANLLVWVGGVTAVVLVLGLIGARTGRGVVDNAQPTTAVALPSVQGVEKGLRRRRAPRFLMAVWILLVAGIGVLFWFAPPEFGPVVKFIAMPATLVAVVVFVFTVVVGWS